jgi:hypothetical protein
MPVRSTREFFGRVCGKRAETPAVRGIKGRRRIRRYFEIALLRRIK